MCPKTTFRATLLLTLYFQLFWNISQNVQSSASHYPSCLCMLCVRVFGQALGSLAQMLLCLPALLGSDQSAKPSVFLLCVCVSASMCVYMCVCVCRREWVWRMPALPRTAQLRSTRDMWHKETSEQVGETVWLCFSMCVHFLNASLAPVVYERGLVLVEQMAEC